MKKGRCFIMRVKLKRVFSFVAAVVICGVSCVTSWFSVPVSAIGVFSPFNFYQLYQMLHGLLLGDGGGNSQTFGEWLEENMTSTIGSGNDKTTFLITPDMKLEDMMSEASMRLILRAACTDGGYAGISKMKKLIDSWTEVYDTSDIGDIGSSSGGYYPSGISCSDGVVRFSSDFFIEHKGEHFPSDSFPYLSISPYKTSFSGDYLYLFCISSNSDFTYYLVSNFNNNISILNDPYSYLRIDYALNSALQFSGFLYSTSNHPSSSSFSSSAFCGILDSLGCQHFSSFSDAYAVVKSSSDWSDKSSTGDSFIGPTYAMPAAKQLITDTGTLSGLRLDVQTEDGTPDISAALDHAGVDSVDDLVSGVAAGTIPMSQVYEDMRVVPYVLTDVETGQVVSDLNVSATDAKTKAVALDKDLSIPKDISAVDAYQVTGKTWDPEMSKYKLPLFQFFPFCLPWDIYEVLTLFDAEPVAPKFTIPVGQFFTRFSGSVDTSKAADQKAVVDLGSDSWQSTFKVIRALECAAIIIGLCLTAVLLIHGGR